jgi:hypothetical protein
VIRLSEPAQLKKQGAQLEKPKLSEPHLKSKRRTKMNQELQNEQILTTKGERLGLILIHEVVDRI